MLSYVLFSALFICISTQQSTVLSLMWSYIPDTKNIRQTNQMPIQRCAVRGVKLARIMLIS